MLKEDMSVIVESEPGFDQLMDQCLTLSFTDSQNFEYFHGICAFNVRQPGRISPEFCIDRTA